MSNFSYHDKQFRPVSNTENGETGSDTLFHYKQNGNLLTAEYAGGTIQYGHLLGTVDEQGVIDMRYHQVNVEGIIMTGICRSVPEILPSGKIRLHEQWRWTSGDGSEGRSILDEI